jgi:phthalate 4,5-cis-dihydrodiol dehydrogenase
MYSDAERVSVRRALREGKIDHDVAKEGMRFGAAAKDASSIGTGASPASKGARSSIHWFGLTVASFERGDIRQSPDGIYVYSDAGRTEVPVFGGRGTGTLEIKEMYEAIFENKPIVHDGRWALATLEVGSAIVESARERREIMLSHQCGLNDG